MNVFPMCKVISDSIRGALSWVSESRDPWGRAVGPQATQICAMGLVGLIHSSHIEEGPLGAGIFLGTPII